MSYGRRRAHEIPVNDSYLGLIEIGLELMLVGSTGLAIDVARLFGVLVDFDLEIEEIT